jgi:hypothetical protein
VDELIVGDPQFHNLSGNLRRYARDLDPYAPVAGPWRHHVMVPSNNGDEHRNECKDQGREPTCPGEDHSRYETALRRFGLLWHQWMLIVFCASLARHYL